MGLVGCGITLGFSGVALAQEGELTAGVDAVSLTAVNLGGGMGYRLDADYNAFYSITGNGDVDVMSRLVIGNSNDTVDHQWVGPYIFALSPGQSTTWPLAVEHTTSVGDEYYAREKVFLGFDDPVNPLWSEQGYGEDNATVEGEGE
jgi:hypothetical protein